LLTLGGGGGGGAGAGRRSGRSVTAWRSRKRGLRRAGDCGWAMGRVYAAPDGRREQQTRSSPGRKFRGSAFVIACEVALWSRTNTVDCSQQSPPGGTQNHAGGHMKARAVQS